MRGNTGKVHRSTGKVDELVGIEKSENPPTQCVKMGGHMRDARDDWILPFEISS